MACLDRISRSQLVHSWFTTGSRLVHDFLRQERGHHTMRSGSPRDANPPQNRSTSMRAPRTRWERMERSELSLAHLRQLLLTGKRSEGKSPKTIAWYEGALDDFARWLDREQLPPV